MKQIELQLNIALGQKKYFRYFSKKKQKNDIFSENMCFSMGGVAIATFGKGDKMCLIFNFIYTHFKNFQLWKEFLIFNF